MVKKESVKIEYGQIAYTLGLISIIAAFFQPLMGVVIGIVGAFQSKKDKTILGRKAMKLNTIGIILCIILFALSLILLYNISGTF